VRFALGLTDFWTEFLALTILTSPVSTPVRRHRASSRVKRIFGRTLIYGALIFWAFVCLFPIYWTVTTSFKSAVDVTQGHLIPWLDFQPDWKGWRSLGLSPDTILGLSNPREEFMSRFGNSIFTSVGASLLALALGSLAAYGLSRFRYKFAWMRNDDILFFFMSQLILPPVVLALPFLVLYKALALLDTRFGLILLYTLTVLPIVIWIMRDQFNAIPIELDEAAFVDGLSVWGAFIKIILPLAVPGMVAAFILSLVLCWNEYFFAALLTSTDAKTLPVMVASQTGSQGINWWSMAALSTAAIAPLVVAGIFLERYIVSGLTAGAGK
jgi:multiple sugar transport system permease protein